MLGLATSGHIEPLPKGHAGWGLWELKPNRCYLGGCCQSGVNPSLPISALGPLQRTRVQNGAFNVWPGARLSGLGKAASLPILGDSWSSPPPKERPGQQHPGPGVGVGVGVGTPPVSPESQMCSADLLLRCIWNGRGAYLLCASPCLKPSRSTSCIPHLCPASTGPSCWNTSHWSKLAWQISRCLPLAGGQMAEGGRRSSPHPPRPRAHSLPCCPTPSALSACLPRCR